MAEALSKLKFLVIIDPLTTETSNFWQNHGEFNDVDPAAIQTEVFRLPSTCFAEEEGSLVNSSRRLQWHNKGGEPPGEVRGKERGFSHATVYDPPGVFGTHVFYVLPHSDRPDAYGLPKPTVSPIVELWRSPFARGLGVAGLLDGSPSMVAVPNEARSRHSCPVCDSPPVAGVVLGDNKLRYLVCGLYSTEWYLPRLICAHCGSTEGISYFGIEGDTSGAKTECCYQCRTYLKLFYLESTPAAEPFADDVATLALDTLVSEEGFSRTGPNFYLLPGAGS